MLSKQLLCVEYDYYSYLAIQEGMRNMCIFGVMGRSW